MTNMSYCRFQNILHDLDDCREHIFDDDLSSDEEGAKGELIACCRGILEDLEE